MEICKNIKPDDFIAAACGNRDESCSWHLPAHLQRRETAGDWTKAQPLLGSLKTWEIERDAPCTYLNFYSILEAEQHEWVARAVGEAPCWGGSCAAGGLLPAPPKVWGCSSVKPADRDPGAAATAEKVQNIPHCREQAANHQGTAWGRAAALSCASQMGKLRQKKVRGKNLG